MLPRRSFERPVLIRQPEQSRHKQVPAADALMDNHMTWIMMFLWTLQRQNGLEVHEARACL
jgi:hypothetical protein